MLGGGRRPHRMAPPGDTRLDETGRGASARRPRAPTARGLRAEAPPAAEHRAAAGRASVPPHLEEPSFLGRRLGLLLRLNRGTFGRGRGHLRRLVAGALRHPRLTPAAGLRVGGEGCESRGYDARRQGQRPETRATAAQRPCRRSTTQRVAAAASESRRVSRPFPSFSSPGRGGRRRLARARPRRVPVPCWPSPAP